MEMLGAALLISNSLNDSLAEEIQETVGKVPAMKALSCQCEAHSNKDYYVAATPKCSPVSCQNPTSLQQSNSSAPIDSTTEMASHTESESTMSKTVTASEEEKKSQGAIPKTRTRKLSINDNNQDGAVTPRELGRDSRSSSVSSTADDNNESDKILVKDMKDAIQALDKMDKDTGLKKDKNKNTICIWYQKRDILDLGKNITGEFGLVHPRLPQGTEKDFDYTRDEFNINFDAPVLICTEKHCNFNALLKKEK